MEPTGDFWAGVGTGIADSPGWMLVGTVLVIGVLFVVAKYIYPGHKELKMRELDLRQMEAENARAQVESNRALAEQTRSAGAKIDALVIQNAEFAAGMKESRTRSRVVGEDVSHIRDTTDHTAEKVDEIHMLIRQGRFGPEGTD